VLLLGSETKVNMEHLGENYDVTPDNTSCVAFDVHRKGDMSLQWKIMKRVCIMRKQEEHVCMFYRCVGNRVHNPLETPCDSCTNRLLSHPDTKCHHHKMGWEGLDKYKAQVTEILPTLESDLGEHDQEECTFCRHDPSRVDDGTTNPTAISLEPANLAESLDLLNNIQDDLLLRDLNIEGKLEESCTLLIERL
jgi:hypothetical protein